MKNIANNIGIVAISVLLLSFFVQTINIVDVDAAKVSREKACTNPRNTQEKDPKFCAHLIVIKNVEGGTATPSDFTISVTSTSRDKPSPSTFPGSSSPGTSVTLGQGSYQVTETGIADNYNPTYSSACSGSISAGQTKTCTVTNTFTPPTGTLTVFKEVVGGTATPSDFTISVSTFDDNTASPSTFQGSSSGTEVTIGEGQYIVFEPSPGDYSPNFSEDCGNPTPSSISAGETKQCTVTNSLSATLTVFKEVVGGTAQASDFRFVVQHMRNINGECRPWGSSGPFPGSEEGFTVKIDTGPQQCGYLVTEDFVQGYTAVRSPECSSNTSPSPGQSLTCIVTNTFTGT